MATKTFFVLCLNLIFIKDIVTQCIGSPAFIPEAYGIAAGIPNAGIQVAGIPAAAIPFAGIPTSIPAAAIQAATIPATGIQTPFTSQLTMNIPMLPSPSFSILSDDLAVEGIVSVAGSLPFLGTVTLGGTVPAIGEGAVNYNCGNGEVGIVREMPTVGTPAVIY